MFNPEITVGNMITILSIFISLAALLVSWNKDRSLKRREYADRIRRTASMVTAKLERRFEISLGFFDEIQPLLAKVDIEFPKDHNIIKIRDDHWHGLVEIRAKTLQRILDEQIEIAYVDLFGYDPKIHALYLEAVNRLKLIDQNIYKQALYLTQEDVLRSIIGSPT